jgi:hypothetical protein
MTKPDKDKLANIEKTRNTEDQLGFYEELNRFIESSGESGLEKMSSFAAYAPRQVVTSFVEKYELFKLIQNVPGSIVECGVAAGQGLMTFAHLCSIFEPYHYTRRIIGFDTFEGFVGIQDEDKATSGAEHMRQGGLSYRSYEKLQRAIELYDRNRALGHLKKVELVKGDITETLPKFLETNPHLVIGLLYMDLDLYKPTLNVLNSLKKRLHKNTLIVFDELNHGDYPGETLAVMEALGLEHLRLQRLSISSMLSYCRLGD